VSKKTAWAIILLAAALGFGVGGTSVAVYLLGPGGYRHSSSSTANVSVGVSSPTPSRALASPVTPASPSATPTAGSAGKPSGINGIAFDAASGQLVAFGSCCSTGSSSSNPWPASETWLWDGSRWSTAQTGSGPVPRVGASMAYDAVRKVVVMHGGYDQRTNWSNDTWAWDGTRWNQLSPLNSPPADGFVRAQPMCWDGQRGEVLLLNE